MQDTTSRNSQGPSIAFVEAMERAVISGDRNEALRYLAADVTYRVGAQDSVVGIDAIFAYIGQQSRVARWDGHTLIAIWPHETALIVEVISHFTRLADNRSISFPCTDIYRFADGRIADWRVYADMSPFAVP